ncbi:hypothetical protein OUZ56_030865 [Daphnia magna]|uniref:Secreted protein n=1 Tax=Daphnia magna TaxID=35525 RepID=A0ABQ9ZSJ6_9CRUS|nr:hypothetical protein OUZ56_030865 [Daphnia magna]
MAGHRCTLPLMSEGRSWIAGHAGLWWAGCCGPEASVERNENPAEREKSSRMRSLEQGRSSQHGHFFLVFVRSFVRSFSFGMPWSASFQHSFGGHQGRCVFLLLRFLTLEFRTPIRCNVNL